MNLDNNFTNHKLWETCSELHKKTLLCPNVFGHVLYENKNEISNLNLINDVIETGTYDGRTSVFFSIISNSVHTIELYEEINPYSGTSFKNLYNSLKHEYKNINFYFGDSPNLLKEILTKQPDTRYLIILDAHTHNYSPLIKELQIIKNTSNINNHVFIVDDCNLLGTVGYPSEEEFKKQVFEINKNYIIKKTNYGNGITIIF